MTNTEKVLEFIKSNRNDLYCDDCLSELLSIEPRQQINQICNRLKIEGKLKREKLPCRRCSADKLLNMGCLN